MSLQDDKTFAELIYESIDDDLYIALANIVKNQIESNGADWEILKAIDSSQTASSGDTYLTMKALPSDFRQMLSDPKISVGTDTFYLPVPFEQRHKYKEGGRKYYIDHANSQFALMGATNGTIYFPYLKTSDEFTALTDSWGFPARFHKIIPLRVVGIIMSGVDSDDYYQKMSIEHKILAASLEEAMLQWNTALALSAMDNSASPIGEGDYDSAFKKTLLNS